MEAQKAVEAIPVLDYAPPARRIDSVRRVLRIAQVYLLVAAIGALIGGAVGWALIPFRYTTTAVILVTPIGPGRIRTLPSPNFSATEAGMLESRALAMSAGQTTAGRDPISQSDWDHSAISADIDRRTDLIHLNVTSADPTIPPRIASAILDAYTAQRLSGSPIQIEIFEPPRVVVRQVNQIALGIFAALGALLASLFLARRKRSRLPATLSHQPSDLVD